MYYFLTKGLNMTRFHQQLDREHCILFAAYSVVFCLVLLMTRQVGLAGPEDQPPIPRPDSVARIWVEPNILVSLDCDIPHLEPTLAVNPRDPMNMLGAAIVFARPGAGHTCKTYASKDGGYTWLDTAFPERLTFMSADPQVAFSPTGTAYFLMLSTGRGMTGHFYRSTDGGLNWKPPVAISNLGDYPQMVVDSTSGKYGGRIYISSHESQTFVMHSADDCQTFSKPIEVPNRNKGIVSNLNPLVFADGTLFVPFKVWEEPPKQNPPLVTVYFVTSHDGGVSFSEPVKCLEFPLAGKESRDREYPFIGTGLSPVFVLDPRPAIHRLYAAWVEPRPEGHRVMLRFSTDGGANWSAPKAVAPAEKGSQYQIMLAVNREGTVGVAWFDTRDFPRLDKYDLYFTASPDGGETFLQPRKVSSEPSAPRGAGNVMPYPPYARRTGTGLEAHFQTAFGRWGAGGDYSAMQTDADGAFRPFWPDSRSGTFQIQTARVRVVQRADDEAALGLKVPEGLTARPVGTKVALVADPPRYDVQKQEGELFLRLRNTSPDRLYGPIRARVAKATGWEQPPAEIDFTPALADLPYLAPGALTGGVRVRFKSTEAKGWPIATLEITAKTAEIPGNQKGR